METIIEQLYSLITPLALPSPPPTFSKLVSLGKTKSNVTLVSCYGQIHEKIRKEIEKKAVNLENIRQLGKFILNSIASDIEIFNKINENIQIFKNFNKKLCECEQKLEKMVENINEVYLEMKGRYRDEEQMLQRFINDCFFSYIREIDEKIIPIYSEMIEILPVVQTESEIELEEKLSEAEFEIYTEKMVEILKKFKSVAQKYYEKMILEKNNTESEVCTAYDFLIKINEIFSDLSEFLIGDNCTINNLSLQNNYRNELFKRKLQISYQKYISSPKISYDSHNILFGFAKQSWLEVAIYLYIDQIFPKELNKVEKQLKLINENILIIFVQPNELIYEKITNEIISVEKTLKDCRKMLSIIHIKLYENVNERLDIAFEQINKFMFVCLNVKKVLLEIGREFNRSKIRVDNIINLFKNQKSIDLLVNLYDEIKVNQMLISKMNQIYIENGNEIKIFLQNKINEISTLRKSFAVEFSITPIKNESAQKTEEQYESKQIKTSDEIKELSSSESFDKSIEENLKVEDLDVLVQKVDYFFEEEIKNYVHSGFELVKYHLENEKNSDRKLSNHNKIQKLKDSIENTVKDLKLKLNLLNRSLSEEEETSQESEYLLKSRKESKLSLPAIKNYEELNESKYNYSVSTKIRAKEKQSLKGSMEQSIKNLEMLLKLLKSEFETRNGQSILSIIEECLSFECQDWHKRLSIFKEEFKIFQNKCKNVQIVSVKNICNTSTYMYKVYKEYLSIMDVVIDILSEISYIFEAFKELEHKTKINFDKKPLNILSSNDLRYLETLFELKNKMNEEIKQLSDFPNIGKSTKNYLKSIYFKFQDSFEKAVPYSLETLSELINSISTAINFVENDEEIFKVLKCSLTEIKKKTPFLSNNILEISTEISKLEAQLQSIMKIESSQIPIDSSSVQKFKNIVGARWEEFRLAEYLSKKNNTIQKERNEQENILIVLEKVKEVYGSDFF